MKGLRLMVILTAVLAASIMVIGPATAWGASQHVAAVDDYYNNYADRVCSQEMGCVYYNDYESAVPGLNIETLDSTAVNALSLDGFDTLFLFACNPAVFTDSQKSDISQFVADGGKLIIWDSEDPGSHGTWNYNWLPTPWSVAVPGAQGASGVLTIVEENDLSSNIVGDPHYINAAKLGSQTDAVGDANVFTSYIPSQWCIDMTADSNIAWMPTGPTHVYTKGAQSDGIIIYCGLDWDYASYQGWSGGVGDELKKILKHEFTAASLPCTSAPPTTLIVTKVADKAVYDVGDPVTFTITVTNPSGQYTASNVGLVDYPPAEITLFATTGNLGDLAPGETKTYQFHGTADAKGCDLENSVVATGYYSGTPIFTGGDTTTFDIGHDCGAPQVPEFPSVALPIGMILGFMFIVYTMKMTRKD